MKVAIAQMNTTPGDFDAIVDKMCSYDTVAHAYGADLIVFPSTVMMGCDPLSLAQCPGYVLDFSSAMGALSERLTTPAIVPFVSGGIGPSVPEAALIRNGAVLPLSIAGTVSNAGQAKPGMAASALAVSPAVVSIAGVSVGVAYSFDELELFASGSLPADVVCFVPFEGYDVDEQATCFAPSVSDGCFVGEAKGADAWIVAANAVGAFGDLAFVGGSFVMAPLPLAALPRTSSCATSTSMMRARWRIRWRRPRSTASGSCGTPACSRRATAVTSRAFLASLSCVTVASPRA